MKQPSDFLLSHGWTCEETPEAVIYTKPGRKPRVYVRAEMAERALELWEEEGASERQSKRLQKTSHSLNRMRWAKDARQRQSAYKKVWWAARRQAAE